MSKIDQNPDGTIPAGKPLNPDQAGTEATDPWKFNRDKAEGEDTTGPAQPR